MKFWGFTYCRGLNSPALYRLSYRGMYSVVASKFCAFLAVPTATKICLCAS